jgi:hypothetical protein
MIAGLPDAPAADFWDGLAVEADLPGGEISCPTGPTAGAEIACAAGPTAGAEINCPTGPTAGAEIGC